MSLNSLQQYMDFADKNGLFSQYKNIGVGNGFQPTQFNVPMMEANWAQGMAGPQMPQQQQTPNYFANFSQTPAPGAQIGENPYSDRVKALFAAQNAPQQAPQMGNNYLARLLR